jgi:poly(A) polymerase
MDEREFATEVVVQLQRAGYEALWAGGCVRDELLGLSPADYDIATNARPEQVMKHFKHCHQFGASFGVVEVLGPRDAQGHRLKVQVATFRSDGTYSDGRRPDSVVFSTAEEDALRRDFTINGLFFDPIHQRILDYVDGQRDLNARILRAIGTPEERFREDKLRILRAVRMATRFELQVEPETHAAARRMADQICVVSVERITEELRKILNHRRRVAGMRLIEDFGLVSLLFPELKNGDESWEQAITILVHLNDDDQFPLALAVMIHSLGSHSAEEVCRRFRLSNAEAETVVWLVAKQRRLFDAPSMRRSELQPLLIHPEIERLMTMHRAMARASGISEVPIDDCAEILCTTPPEKLNPAPLLSGDDLRAMGRRPGPAFKKILDSVRVAQLNGELQSREQAIHFVLTQNPL